MGRDQMQKNELNILQTAYQVLSQRLGQVMGENAFLALQVQASKQEIDRLRIEVLKAKGEELAEVQEAAE